MLCIFLTLFQSTGNSSIVGQHTLGNLFPSLGSKFFVLKKKKRYVEQDYCFPQSKSPALESFQNTMPLSLSIPQLTE